MQQKYSNLIVIIYPKMKYCINIDFFVCDKKSATSILKQDVGMINPTLIITVSGITQEVETLFCSSINRQRFINSDLTSIYYIKDYNIQ